MKKIIGWTLAVLVVLIIAAALTVHLFLDDAIKRGVETYGPELTKVSVKLDSVSLLMLSGSGKIKGLVIGNPDGYKFPSAIEVGTGGLAIKPASVFSDKIVVQSILLEGPMLTYETDLKSSNLGKIRSNLEGTKGTEPAKPAETKPTETKPAESKPSKKFEVDDFLLKGAKLHVSVNVLGNSQSTTVTLPDIHLKDLGKGSDGLTAAEITQQVLGAVLEEAEKKAVSVVADLSKGATYLTPDVRNAATNTLEKATKGLGDLFKKK